MVLFIALSTALFAGPDVELAGSTYRVLELEAPRGEVQPLGADLNGDGAPELLVAGGTQVWVYGYTDQSFTLVQRAAAGAGAEYLDVADLNGDGRADVVVANHETDHLTLLFAGSDGALKAPPGSRLQVPVDPHPHVVRTLDLSGDGHADLLVDDRNGHGLRYLEGDGRGGFNAAGLIDVGGDPYRGFAVGDLNGDGRLDIVTPNPDRVAVVLGEAGGFRRAPDVRASAPFAVALADLDGDGDPDLLVADSGRRSELRAFRGDGTGVFSPFGEPVRMARGAKAVVTADIDGDGFQDALVCGWNGELFVALGASDGLRVVRLPPGTHPWGLAIADFNGDGRGDLVVAEGIDGTLRVFLSGGS